MAVDNTVFWKLTLIRSAMECVRLSYFLWFAVTLMRSQSIGFNNSSFMRHTNFIFQQLMLRTFIMRFGFSKIQRLETWKLHLFLTTTYCLYAVLRYLIDITFHISWDWIFILPTIYVKNIVHPTVWIKAQTNLATEMYWKKKPVWNECK